MKPILNSIKIGLRDLLAPYPSFFIPIYRALAPEANVSLLISPKTEIVIEGFPRSANTYAVVAFLKAQKRYINIAHHLHVESQILEGVKRKLPVLVLIRHPKMAIRSLYVRHPAVKFENALKRYINFYTAVEKVRDKVIISDFEHTTNDLASVIRSINFKFNTDFSVYESTPENLASVFSEIEAINEKESGGLSTHVAKPMVDRIEIYRNLEINYPQHLLQDAISLYNSLVS